MSCGKAPAAGVCAAALPPRVVGAVWCVCVCAELLLPNGTHTSDSVDPRVDPQRILYGDWGIMGIRGRCLFADIIVGFKPSSVLETGFSFIATIGQLRCQSSQ